MDSLHEVLRRLQPLQRLVGLAVKAVFLLVADDASGENWATAKHRLKVLPDLS